MALNNVYVVWSRAWCIRVVALLRASVIRCDVMGARVVLVTKEVGVQANIDAYFLK